MNWNLKLHLEQQTAKSTISELEKQTIPFLSFPVIDLECSE